MTSLISKSVSALALTLAFTAPAMANTVSVSFSALPSSSLPYTQTGLLGNKSGSTLGYFAANWGGDATSVWTTNTAGADVNPQSPASVLTWVQNTSGASGLSLLSSNDTLGGGTSMTFDFSSAPINYLAIHYGQAESLFYFQTAVSTFSLDLYGGNFGLSNYRAYGTPTPPSAVPLPAALPLMLSGLGFLGFTSRRKGIGAV